MPRLAPAIVLLAFAAATVNCGGRDVNAVLGQEAQAKRASADLLTQFVKAADSANRAVMADTDDASVAFAKEAEAAKQAIEKDTDELRPILQSLNYSDETGLLIEFERQFRAYSELDSNILDLAVQNTNLKAQRLSFGPAQESSDAFRDALHGITAASAGESWHVKALIETAIASVREIQVLQAPHIAGADDATMISVEKRMAAAESSARSTLKSIGSIASPASRQKLTAASVQLDKFLDLNTQLVALSRRNTNVRSLALSLDQKRPLIAACENAARSLRDALAKHGYPAGR